MPPAIKPMIEARMMRMSPSKSERKIPHHLTIGNSPKESPRTSLTAVVSGELHPFSAVDSIGVEDNWP
jgi:hypothetical protein